MLGLFYDQHLEQFLYSAPRNKMAVILTKSLPNDMLALNIGKELSAAIESVERVPDIRFQYEVTRALNKIVHNFTQHDTRYGDYIIISNPGILFETELNVNVTDFLARLSRNTLTILYWPGEANEDGLWLMKVGSKYIIKQSELNYIIL